MWSYSSTKWFWMSWMVRALFPALPEPTFLNTDPEVHSCLTSLGLWRKFWSASWLLSSESAASVHHFRIWNHLPLFKVTKCNLYLGLYSNPLGGPEIGISEKST